MTQEMQTRFGQFAAVEKLTAVLQSIKDNAGRARTSTASRAVERDRAGPGAEGGKMTIVDWKAARIALEQMPERDKQIYALARKISNSLCFALQNTHSERIMEKYERAADDAMNELINLLIARKEAQ